MTTSNFFQSTDAQAWATEFIKRVEEDPAFATDEGTMLGWFANAIMAGYDEARRKYEMVNRHDITMFHATGKEVND